MRTQIVSTSDKTHKFRNRTVWCSATPSNSLILGPTKHFSVTHCASPMPRALTFGARKPNLKLESAIGFPCAEAAFFFGGSSIMLSKFLQAGR